MKEATVWENRGTFRIAITEDQEQAFMREGYYLTTLTATRRTSRPGADLMWRVRKKALSNPDPMVFVPVFWTGNRWMRLTDLPTNQQLAEGAKEEQLT